MLIPIGDGSCWLNPDKIISIFVGDGGGSYAQLEVGNFNVTSEELKQILAYHNPYQYKYVYGEKTSVDVLKES